MKYSLFFLILFFFASISWAENPDAFPKSKVSTPIQTEISKESPSLTETETADWSKRREERRKARSEMLSKIRKSSPSEREQMRNSLEKNRGENSRMKSEFPKNGNRPSFNHQGMSPETGREHHFKNNPSGQMKNTFDGQR